MRKKFNNPIKKSLLALIALALMAVPARQLVIAASCSSTRDCNEQISDLQDANAGAQSSLNNLIAQAGSYQAAIGALQAQIDSLNQLIQANEAKQAQIQAEIVQKQAELDQQRKVLGTDIKAMYVDGQMSTIEMLATSKNLSDYVDKEEYRQIMQTKIQNTMADIAKLQKQLAQQKADVDSLLASEKSQQSELDADRAQQAALLSYNQSQQNNFNAQISSNRAQIKKLQAQQAALNAVGSTAVYVSASGGTGGNCANPSNNQNGGYPMPWCNAAQDSVVTSYHPSPGNYTNRECTSFAYWYFTSVEGHSDFRVGYGDAKYWISNSNYPVHDDPAVGAIGVKTVGAFGHVVIVKATAGQTFGGVTVPAGEVLVYEMNYDYTGHFRAALRDVNTFAGFLY
jgi:peptidoglycan hydrolase CwlO-like protein/surface antigen